MPRSMRFNITAPTEDELKAIVDKVSDAVMALDEVYLSSGWFMYQGDVGYLTQLHIDKTNKTTWGAVKTAIDNAIGYMHYVFV